MSIAQTSLMYNTCFSTVSLQTVQLWLSEVKKSIIDFSADIKAYFTSEVLTLNVFCYIYEYVWWNVKIDLTFEWVAKEMPALKINRKCIVSHDNKIIVFFRCFKTTEIAQREKRERIFDSSHWMYEIFRCKVPNTHSVIIDECCS